MLQKNLPYDVPEEVVVMVNRVRQFREEILEPIWEKVDEDDHIPDNVVQKMRELGLFGLSTPKQYGGLGLSALGEVLVQEELSKSSACFRSRIASTNGIGSQGIAIDGTEEQKQKYMPKYATGEWTGCFAMTEPDAGSDAASIKTTAELRGDHWVLNGVKQFITNGSVADTATVVALTDPQKRAKGGITTFIVEKDSPGFKIGKIHRGMGLRGNNATQLVFENCKISKNNVIGGERMIGQGFKTAMRIMDKGRLLIGAHALGGAQRCLELSLEYSKRRKQFGNPINTFQFIQGMLADMATEIYAARQMLYHAAWLRDKYATAVLMEASMVKKYCTEVAMRAADNAVQIHGGYGWMKGYQVERFFRDLRLLTIFEGTNEIQKIVIARELLKKAS